jgi:Protein of unknown function (DUF3309)
MSTVIIALIVLLIAAGIGWGRRLKFGTYHYGGLGLVVIVLLLILLFAGRP